MDKIWAGRFKNAPNALANEFNSSIGTDFRMYKQDIDGSAAHVKMLAACGIITNIERDAITKGLASILSDIDSNRLQIDFSAEDIHSFIEKTLTDRIGEAGKKLHTARSRNDQVALDTRLYLRSEIDSEQALLKDLIGTINGLAKTNIKTVMPGYTHLQRAQPISFAQYILAYANMFMRDYDRLSDCRRRTNRCPLGAAALAGTTYPIDRSFAAEQLGFDGICENSLDAVSDRDYIIELSFVNSMIAMHISRLAEELILWCTSEFSFIEFSEAFSTGSSIMPQKKNPDIAELLRGKSGRIYGDLTALLTVLKGLPLAYNKDLQEDKHLIFDSCDNVKLCLSVLSPMLSDMKINADNMKNACNDGFINATDCADYLTKKGVPFRDAYKITGELVAYCIENKLNLLSLPIEIYQKYSAAIGDDIYSFLDINECMEKRISEGGTSSQAVLEQIKIIDNFLGNIK